MLHARIATMELKLEVLSSVSIKRKKPWPRFAWLGEPESSYHLFLLDNHRTSQLSLSTGKTRKTLPSLAAIQPQIVLTSHSPNGAFLGGLTNTGDLFLWHPVTEVLETHQSPLSGREKTAALQDSQGHRLFLSDSGEQALLVCNNRELYLWEVDGSGVPVWWEVTAPSGVLLPESTYRETSIDASFFVHSVLGECCGCVFVFTGRETRQTVVTHLLIQWHSPDSQFYHHYFESLHAGYVRANQQELPAEASVVEPPATKTPRDENTVTKMSSSHPLKDRTNIQRETVSLQECMPKGAADSGRSEIECIEPGTSQIEQQEQSSASKPSCNSGAQFSESAAAAHERRAPFHVFWKTVLCSPENADESLSPPSGKGCYVAKFSPTGNVVAVAFNYRSAANTQVLFFSLLTEAGIASPVYHTKDSRKSGRTYWVADMAWTADGLLLACMTRRGSFMVLPRFSPPVKLVTQGCSLDMGPSYSLPLHPLITVLGVTHNHVTNHENSQSSERDLLRQRFSVATHPHFPILLCSDGYSLTALKLSDRPSLASLAVGLASGSRQKLGLPPLEPLKEQSSSVDVNDPSAESARECFTENEVSHPVTELSHNPQGPEYWFMKELSRTMHANDLDATFASSFAASGFGFIGGLSGLEAGAIHFAGVDSDLDQTQSSILGRTLQQEHAQVPAIAELHASWALLLSTADFEPGNGMYPQDRPLSASEVNTHYHNVTYAGRLVISTLTALASMNTYKQGTSTMQETGPADKMTLAVGLVALDSVEHKHRDLATLLVNAVCLALLYQSLQEHKKFISLKEDEHSLRSLKEFADQVEANIASISDFMSSAISLLNSVYCFPSAVVPCSPVENFSSLKGSRGSQNAMVAHLVASLSSLAGVVGVLWNDIKLSNTIAKKILPRKSTTDMLQLREYGLLYRNFLTSMKKASSLLQSTYIGTTEMLQHLSIIGVRPGVKKSNVSAEKLYFEGAFDRAWESFAEREPQEQIRNPITSMDAPSTRCQGEIANALSLLFIKLEQYDLRSSLEMANSFTAGGQDRKGQRKESTQISRSNSVATVNEAGSKVKMNRSKSWTALHREPSLQLKTSTPSSAGGSKDKVLLKSQSGIAVVTSIARFMMAFFCNKPLLVLPATRPFILPPVFKEPHPNSSRHKELNHSAVSRAIREQGLSEQWSPDTTLELLLLCGLWEEAWRFLCFLGDWKKGFLLAAVHFHHTKKLNETLNNPQIEAKCKGLKKIPHQIALRSVAGILDLPRIDDIPPAATHKPLTRPRSEASPPLPRPPKHKASFGGNTQCVPQGPVSHTPEALQSVSNTLRVCAQAEIDSVLVRLVDKLLASLVKACKTLPPEVAPGLYLPAPPPYCPQPSIAHEVYVQCPSEFNLRVRTATTLQSLLAILKVSHCLQPCVQWYCHELRHLHSEERHKFDCFAPPQRAQQSRIEQLLHFLATRASDGISFLENTKEGGTGSLPFSVRFVLAAFRQLCGLLWLLHVRDQASLHIRKLHPPTPQMETQRDQRVLEEGALWAARLLPFSEFLLSRTKHLRVEDIALSVISELPPNTFTADLLASCFPDANFEHNYKLDMKMQRLVARLRSTADTETCNSGKSQAEPLSVRYQTRTQRLLAAQEALDTPVRKFQILVHSSPDAASDGGAVLSETALQVGSFLYEHEEEYLSFLDTLFAVVCPAEDPSFQTRLSSSSARVSQGPRGEGPVLPYLSEYCSAVANAHVSSGPSCWEQLLPLLSALSEWSQTGSSQPLTRMQGFSDGNYLKHKTTKRRSQSELQPVAMRVNLSPSFVVTCLQQHEEQVLKPAHKDGNSNATPSSLPPKPSLQSDPVSENRVAVEATPPAADCVDASRSLCLADLEHSVNASSAESGDKATGSAQCRTPPVLETETVTRQEDADLLSPRISLLQVPEEVLQGQLPLHAVESLVGRDSSLLRVSCPVELSPALMTNGNGENSVDFSQGEFLAHDEELTDSCSTGELPTPLTFSIGEFGSRLRPSDTPSTGFGRSLPLEDTGQHEENDRYPIPDIATTTHTAPARSSELLEQKQQRDGREGGADTNDQPTSPSQPCEGDSGERKQDQNGSQEEGEGGGDREGLGAEGEGGRGGGDTEGLGGGGEEGEGGGDTEGLGGGGEEGEGGGDTEGLGGGGEEGGGGGDREGEEGEGGGDREGLGGGGLGGGDSNSESEKSRTEGDITSISSTTEESQTRVPRSQPHSDHHLVQESTTPDEDAAAAVTGSEKPDCEEPYHPGLPPRAPPSAQPGAAAGPAKRGRHISGISMATTISTDFSDGLPHAAVPLFSQAHETTAPPGGGDHEFPPQLGPPAIQESSVTTGSTEEDMRKLGLRERAGPLQSTAVKEVLSTEPQNLTSSLHALPPSGIENPQNDTPTRKRRLPNGRDGSKKHPQPGKRRLHGSVEVGRRLEFALQEPQEGHDSEITAEETLASLPERERVNGEQPVSREGIGRIVKSEMKKILKLQHEHLLELLETTASEGTPQLQAHSENLEPAPVVPDPRNVGMESEAPVDPQQHEDSMAPLLNLDELQSTIDPDHPTHITIFIPPSQPQMDLKPQQQTTEQRNATEQETRAISPSESKKKDGPPKPSACSESDLSVSDLFYSPGAVYPLASNNLSTATAMRDDNRPQTVQPKQQRAEGVFSQIKQTGRCGEIPLLHIDAEEMAPKPDRCDKDGFTLQEQFPHLVRNLREFNSSVTSARHPFSTKPSESGGIRLANADLAHGIPLLKIPAPSDPTFTTTRTRPPALHSLRPTGEVPAGKPTPMTLLQLPREVDVLPGMVMPREKTTAPTLSQQFLKPPKHPVTIAQVSLHRQHKHEPSEVPLVTASSHPFPLLTLPSPAEQPHPHFAGISPAPPPPLPQADFKLPHVPIKPYIPKLIPPHVLQMPPQTAPLRLLKLEDPLSRMKQEGFKLLQFPAEIQTGAPQKLLRVEPGHSAYAQPHKATLQLPPAGPKVPKGQPQGAAVFPDVARRKTESSSSEEDGGVSAVKEPTTTAEDARHRRQKSRARRRYSGERHISWKKQEREMADPLPPRPPVETGTLPQPQAEEETQYHRETPPEYHLYEIVTPYSPPEPSSPTGRPLDAPLERLEVQRLQMGASYLPSSSSEEGEEEGEKLQDKDAHHPSGEATLGGQDELDSMVQGARNGGFPHESLDLQEGFGSDSETPEIGHQFISVVDIEGDASCLIPVPKSADSTTPPLTVPSQRDARVSDYSQSESCIVGKTTRPPVTNATPQTSSGVSEQVALLEPPVLPSSDPDAHTSGSLPLPEGTKAEAVLPLAEFDREILPTVASKELQAGGPPSSPTPATGRAGVHSVVLERLRLLEEQLNAIESTAQAMEGEFKLSNQLLQTIDQLQIVSETTSSKSPPIQAPPKLPQSHTPPHVPQGTENKPGEPHEQFVQETPQMEAISSRAEPTQALSLHPCGTERHAHAQERIPDADTTHATHGVGTPSPKPINLEVDTRNRAATEAGVSQTLVEVAPPQEDEEESITHAQKEMTNTHPETESGPVFQDSKSAPPLPKTTLPVARPPIPPATSESTPPLSSLPKSSSPPTPPSSLSTTLARPPLPVPGSSGKPKEHVQFLDNGGMVQPQKQTQDATTRRSSSAEHYGGGDSRRKLDREDLRVWVDTRRRERLTGLVTQREGLHKTKKHTLQPPPQAKADLAKLRTQRRQQKREQEKEFLARRIQDAFSLMSDILTSKPEKPAVSSAMLQATSTLQSSQLSDGRKQFGSSGRRLSPEAKARSKHKSDVVNAVSHSERSEIDLHAKGRLSSTYTKGPPPRVHSSTETSLNTSPWSSLKGTRLLSSPKGHKIRRISSVEGLTEEEQVKMAQILASTECDTSGSVVSSIDWEEVDKILES